MKQCILILAASLLALQSCVSFSDASIYSDVKVLDVSVAFPSGASSTDLEGIEVTAKDMVGSASYMALTDENGNASLSLRPGLYRITTSTVLLPEGPYNISKSGIQVGKGGVSNLPLQLKKGRIGDICIKEIYCGGCMKLPEEGTYQADSYVILHNNSASTAYLDGLCFGTLDPYNATATNVWEEGIEFVPVVQAVWQFPGEGKDHPLAPGEDAVIAIFGAIDHKKQYPLSVNLDKPGYFVTYNSTYFYNTAYHPAPGSNIAADHYLTAVVKLGRANAYTFSTSSPAVVIFRPEGAGISEFLASAGNVIQKPGSLDDRIVCIPEDWVEDGVEVFAGQSSTNKKRFHSIVDAGYVTLGATHTGKTLMRKVNEAATAAAGYEVLCDTNNSSADFYERSKQSLHDE